MIDERNPRQGQAGEETTCDLTLQQPDQSSVFQDHQVESRLKNTKYKIQNSQTSPPGRIQIKEYKIQNSKQPDQSLVFQERQVLYKTTSYNTRRKFKIQNSQNWKTIIKKYIVYLFIWQTTKALREKIKGEDELKFLRTTFRIPVLLKLRTKLQHQRRRSRLTIRFQLPPL